SPSVRKLLHTLHEEMFLQFPCLPCAYCSALTVPKKAKWVQYSQDVIYPLTQTFPDIQPVHHPDPTKTTVAVCNNCWKSSTRRRPPNIGNIPPEIRAVPPLARQYLSPISLNCSLGRTNADGENAHQQQTSGQPVNNFTTYRFLTGTFGYSKNQRAHALH